MGGGSVWSCIGGRHIAQGRYQGKRCVEKLITSNVAYRHKPFMAKILQK
jgi:hypothetical protein